MSRKIAEAIMGLNLGLGTDLPGNRTPRNEDVPGGDDLKQHPSGRASRPPPAVPGDVESWPIDVREFAQWADDQFKSISGGSDLDDEDPYSSKSRTGTANWQQTVRARGRRMLINEGWIDLVIQHVMAIND